MTETEFQTKVLAGVEDLQGKITSLETAGKTAEAEVLKLKAAANEVATNLENLRKSQLALKAARAAAPRVGEVSDDCARFFGALAIIGAQRQGQMEHIGAHQRDIMLGIAKDYLGEHHKTALSSSDIPLPVEYSGQVVELVSAWGAARKYGTVFPLGTGSVKLPRLKTDTTFTLLAQSTAITEKSPQTEWVTFTPEKFGGLIRLPTELDEDSIVPIGQFIARYAARNIARVEDTNFWVGSGAASTVYGTAEGATYLTITNTKTSVTGTLASPSELTLAHLRAVRAKPDAAALATSAYYLHPSFEQLLSTFNTAGDKPYNPQAQIQGSGANPFTTGPTLDGFPIRWVDAMPVYTTADTVNAVYTLFGDMSYLYLGVRGGIRFQTSMDAGFATDETLIRALERFTVGCMATGAFAGNRAYSS